MIQPPITVLMPVYNAELFLSQAIESILKQTFSEFEFLIINDGSTDASEEIILSYSDKRIRYLKNNQNLKLIATLNKGMELALGKYIARMDADDISLPYRLETQFNFMETNAKVAVCGSWFQILGNETRVVKYAPTHNEIMMKMLYQCHLCHPAVIIRKSMVDCFAVKFDSQFIHAEDYDFFTRVGEKFELANIQQVLLKYRIHEKNVSVQNKEVQNQNSLLVKKRLFMKLGLDVTNGELDLFRSLMQFEYERNENYLDQVKQLLERLLGANERTAFYEKKYFKKYLMRLWYNTAYNTTQLGWLAVVKYQSSNLLRYRHLHLFKLHIKALLKKK